MVASPLYRLWPQRPLAIAGLHQLPTAHPSDGYPNHTTRHRTRPFAAAGWEPEDSQPATTKVPRYPPRRRRVPWQFLTDWPSRTHQPTPQVQETSRSSTCWVVVSTWAFLQIDDLNWSPNDNDIFVTKTVLALIYHPRYISD